MKVLLIHGLSRSPMSLMSLAWYLQTTGWPTEHFGYAAFWESFDQIVVRLRQQIQQLASQSPYSIVAHSLGGLLARAALEPAAVPQPAHVVMLGPPNQPPRLAPLAWQVLPFQWVTGQCGFNLSRADFFQKLPPLRSPYSIVAGTSGPRGLLSPFGNDVNDGIVAVDETRLAEGDRLIELPVEHTFMMYDPGVQAVVVERLKHAEMTKGKMQNVNFLYPPTSKPSPLSTSDS